MDGTRPADNSRNKEWQPQTDRHELQYGRGDFLIDKIQPDELGKELLSVGELVANDE